MNTENVLLALFKQIEQMFHVNCEKSAKYFKNEIQNVPWFSEILKKKSILFFFQVRPLAAVLRELNCFKSSFYGHFCPIFFWKLLDTRFSIYNRQLNIFGHLLFYWVSRTFNMFPTTCARLFESDDYQLQLETV